MLDKTGGEESIMAAKKYAKGTPNGDLARGWSWCVAASVGFGVGTALLFTSVSAPLLALIPITASAALENGLILGVVLLLQGGGAGAGLLANKAMWDAYDDPNDFARWVIDHKIEIRTIEIVAGVGVIATSTTGQWQFAMPLGVVAGAAQLLIDWAEVHNDKHVMRHGKHLMAEVWAHT